MFKQTFYNDLIISKKSSRKGVQYVGEVTNPNVWRFFLCVMLEGLHAVQHSSMPFWGLFEKGTPHYKGPYP